MKLIKKERKKRVAGNNSVLLSDNMPFSVSESYKGIRTNILHVLRDAEKKSFAITSPSPGTGKTTVTVNLGITFAQLGQKTVIIDADMRKPMIAKLFSIQTVSGLSEYLSGENNEVEVNPTVYPGLYAVTAGKIPHNPSELLSSPRFSQLLNKLSEEFEYIIVDTPPVGMVTDAAVISDSVSGTVVVIKQNYTYKDRFDKTIENLKKVDANIIGYVLNAVDENKYSYKYGHYSYYGNDEYGQK